MLSVFFFLYRSSDLFSSIPFFVKQVLGSNHYATKDDDCDARGVYTKHFAPHRIRHVGNVGFPPFTTLLPGFFSESDLKN